MVVLCPRWAAEHCSVFRFPRIPEGILIMSFTVNKKRLAPVDERGGKIIAQNYRSSHEPMERTSRSKNTQRAARVTGGWRQCRKGFRYPHASH